MPKSKHRKEHKKKLNVFKENNKKQQEVLKKNLMDNYIKLQQDLLQAKESHKSTEEVSGIDVDVTDLNDDWNSMNGDIEIEPVIDAESIQIESNNETINTENNDNNNK